jgi:nitrogen regulatory protein PII
MDLLGGAKLITAILPKGRGIPVVRALKDEKGLAAANVNSARGTGRITHRARRKAITETEKDILTVVVPCDRQDEIFAFIYENAEIGRPHGGLIYQTDLSVATVYSLPDIPDEA